MSQKSIDANIVDLEKTASIVKVEVVMNGVKKIVPMRYVYSNGKFEAKGYIDLFDFQASKALSSINKACFEKHQGKTWNDVEIGFSLHVKTTCN